MRIRGCALLGLVAVVVFGGIGVSAVTQILPVNGVSPPLRPLWIIYVPGDYPTIAQALAVATADDTVQVAAGTYHEGLLTVPQGVNLVGAGWESTVIDGDGADVVIYPDSNSLVEGFTIQGSGPDYFDAGLWVDYGTVTIRGNRITGNATGVWSWCFDAATCAINITLEANVIADNSNDGINSNEYPVFAVRNNTVVSNGGSGVVLNNAGSLAENNIIAGNASNGLANNSEATVHYNDVWGNGQDYVGGNPGTGDIFMDPLFRSREGADYRLHAGSPAVGHGTPSGTDMGALPFIAVGTPPTGITVTQIFTFTWSLSWADSGAIGYNVYLGTQSGFFARRFDAGNANTFNLSGLPGDLTYYAAVSAYDVVGDESHVSSEVSLFVPPAPDGLYEEDSLAIVLTGNWTQMNDTQASGGGYAVSDTAGDTVQFTFSGDSVALYRTLNTDGGRAEAFIDGTTYGALEFYFSEQQWQVPAIFDDLGSGSHALTLRVSSNAHTGSTGHKVTVDAFAVPSPYTSTVPQQQALERVNWHRQIAGIPLVAAPGALNMAAQAHAEYDVVNGKIDGHQEIPGKPGFVGQWPSDRAAYFGYNGGVGEDMHGIGEPIAAIDGFMATVYHRNLIMGYGFADMGYGMAISGAYRSDVLDMSSRPGASLAPDVRFLYTYPTDGQVDVPHSWSGGEAPDPLPGVPKPVGYPVSLYIAQPASLQRSSARFSWLALQAAQSVQWEVTVAELRDANGQLISTYFLDQNTDPNDFLGADNVFLIAHDPLELDATYTAHVAGSDSRDQAFEHTWSFTTQVAASIKNFYVNANACAARVSWYTAGEATTWIEYGPSDSYGWQVSGESAPSTYHWAELPDLTPETTYHYRIVSQDDQGHTRTTDDSTFATRRSQVYHVPADYGAIEAALAEAEVCDVVQVAAGTYQESGLVVPEGASLIGAGWQSTVIAGSGAGSVLLPAPDSVVEGLTVQGSGSGTFDGGFWITRGSVTVRNSRITGNATGVWSWCFDAATCNIHITMEGNIIDGNNNDGINSNEPPVFTVRNNTVANNGGRGLILGNAGSLAENNIVVGNVVAGVDNDVGATVHYNDVWGNGQDYSGGGPGIASLSLDPMFRNGGSGDYRLYAGSPAVGHGTPPGTDMGALPFIPVGSPPTQVSAYQTGHHEGMVTWAETGVAGYIVYLGTEPGLYTQRFDAGTATAYPLSNLSPYQTCYVAVSGLDLVGDESQVSSEASLFVSSFLVVIQGASTAIIGTDVMFTATVSPPTTTQPITYIWQTAEQTITHIGDLDDVVDLSWSLPGIKTITVTVTNSQGTVSRTHSTTVIAPPQDLTISGSHVGVVGETYTFNVTVSPDATTQPITYVWQTSEQTVTHVGALSDTVALSWEQAGGKTITVTATNRDGSLVSRHAFMVHAPPTDVMINGPITATVGDHNIFTATVSPLTATHPITYVWQTAEQTATHIGDLDDTVRFMLLLPGPQTITLTAANPAGIVSVTHVITLDLASETRVTISGPISGIVEQSIVFTATTVLGTMILPDTYIWEATGQKTTTHSNTVRDTVAFAWTMGGTKTITASVTRLGSTLILYTQDTCIIVIEEKKFIYLPLVLRDF